MTTDAAAAILTQSVDGKHTMLCVKHKGQPFGDDRKFVLSLCSKKAWLDAPDADIVQFKQVLKRRRIEIVQCLVSKMLTYSIGRQLETIDRGEVDRIVKALGGENARLRDMIHAVVTSDLFLHN